MPPCDLARLGLALLLAASIILHSLVYVTMQLSKNVHGSYSYSPVEVTFLSEVLKFVISLGTLVYLRWSSIKFDYEPMSWRESLKWSVPAVIYAVNNNVGYATLYYLKSPVRMQVLSSLDILIVGVLTRVCLSRRMNATQWASLVLLANGVASSQLATCANCHSFEDYPVIGVVLVMATCGLSAAAAVYTEKRMKGGRPMSLHQQNCHLYGYGVLVNFGGLLVKDRNRLGDDMAFSGFTATTVFLVMTFAALGLVTSALIKHMSAVIKSFAASSAMFLTTIVSALLFGFKITVPFILAMINVFVAIFLYRVQSLNAAPSDDGTELQAYSAVATLSLIHI